MPETSINTAPLSGRTVLVTRARRATDELICTLENWGAEVFHCPLLEIVEPTSYQPLDQALISLERYDWVIFTSKNSVTACLTRMEKLGIPKIKLGEKRILTVGPATASSLNAAEISVTLVAKEFRAEGALASLKEYYAGGDLLSNSYFLFPRAAQGRELLVVELERLGAKVDLVEAYQTTAPAQAREILLATLTNKQIDVITFTSPSAIFNMVELVSPASLPQLIATSTIASIGPVTEKAVNDCGLTSTICPTQASAVALATAIRDYLSQNR